MAKFIPQELLEPIEFDFTAYGGRAGVIPEPTTKQVTTFFKSMKSMARNVKGVIGEAKRLETQANSVDETVDEADIDEILNKIDSMEEGVSEFQIKSMEAIAVLCGAHVVEADDNGPRRVEGGSPSFQELESLPHRVMQAFTQWLVKEIQPKKETPGTNS